MIHNVHANSYLTQVLEVSIDVQATGYGDSHDSSNEYKLDLRLQAKTGKIRNDSGPTLGVLKASDSKNVYAFFSPYERINFGDSLNRKTKVILPKTVMEKTKLKLKLLEADFTVPVPGPCCIYINNDDLEIEANIDLSRGEQSLIYKGASSTVFVEIKVISESDMDLDLILEQQMKYLYGESSVRFGKPMDLLLYQHVIKFAQ